MNSEEILKKLKRTVDSGEKCLDLKWNHIGPERIKTISESPYLLNIKVLNLNINDMGDKGVKSLAESPYLSNLRRLDLWRNKAGEEGDKAIK